MIFKSWVCKVYLFHDGLTCLLMLLLCFTLHTRDVKTIY